MSALSLDRLTPKQRALLEMRLRQNRAARSSTITRPVPTILSRQRAVPDTVPLSFAQQRLWFVDQLVPGSSSLNVSAAVSLMGNLVPEVLEKALNEVSRRHEILRTTFDLVDGQPVQLIAPPRPVPLPVLDLSGLPEEGRTEQATRWARQVANEPFDLARGPLWRTVLLRQEPRRYTMLLVMHHIVCDAWSVKIFVREMATLYCAFLRGEPSPLPELPIQYADFSVWQQQWLRGEVLERQRVYWKTRLEGASGFLDLSGRPRMVPAVRGAQRPITWPADLSENLRELSRREGTTLFMTLLAAFKAVLHFHTRQQDILVGSPVAYRNWAEVEGLVGCFVNTLVLRTDLSGDLTFRELLARVRAVALEAYAHQDMPFERLVEDLGVVRSAAYNPLFQVGFTVQSLPKSDLRLPDIELSAMRVDREASQLDLVLHLIDSEQELTGNIEYKTEVLDEATVERIGTDIEALLRQVLERPEARLDELGAALAAMHESRHDEEKRERKKLNGEMLRQMRRRGVGVPAPNLLRGRQAAEANQGLEI